jgi:outer membrane protein
MVAALLMGGVGAHAEQKIGYIDMQKAIQGTTTGKKAKSDLEVEFNKKKKDFEKKDADLKKMGEDLQRKKAVLSEEAFQKKQAEFQDEMMKFRDVVNKSQLEIQKREGELIAPIVEKLRGSMEKVAKEGGFSMILEKNQNIVLWAQNDLDLTDKVVAEYEKSAKK